MSEMLKKNQVVFTEVSKLPCKIDELLGSGSQGEVYRALINEKAVALKWYFSGSATDEQRTALESLIKKGPPNNKFLWPIELVSEKNLKGFGYIMPLREKRFGNIVDLMKRRIAPSLRVLATIGLELSNNFLQLHSKGLCYRDISFGNAFFDPNTGEVMICDNDNVSIHGDNRQCGVIGTPRFIAPEVVLGKAKPCRQTDLYSLAVLLFYILFTGHPLDGKKEADINCLNLPAMTKLYGKEPVFIFDPVDQSNRPVPGHHDNPIIFWTIYPEFLKKFFIRAFTEGITDPANGRVGESEWRAAMVTLRDSIIYCSCGAENFYDSQIVKNSDGGIKCWDCEKSLIMPPRIKIGRNIIMLNHDTKIFPHHVDSQMLYDFSAPVAEISRNPNKPDIWGLKNLSVKKWVLKSSNGNFMDVEPNRSVPIVSGNTINFGKIDGEIMA